MSAPVTIPNAADKRLWAKSSLKVYTKIEDGATLKYVGKTQPEVLFNPGEEAAEWFDNTEGTQVLYAVDPDKIDPKVTFRFMQIAHPGLLALAINANTIDDTDPNKYVLYKGSLASAYIEAEWHFVGKTLNGDTMTLVIPNGICQPMAEDMTFGTPGAYQDAPLVIRALQDTSLATDRDLYYWELPKLGS